MQSKERDRLFSTHVRDVADIKIPWLFSLLQACSATVSAEPGQFRFEIPSSPGEWHSVPEVGLFIVGMPWIESQSQIH